MCEASHRSRSIRSAFIRGLAMFLAVLSVAPARTASAAPADIFSIAAPVIGADPPKANDIKDGDATVSTQTGALSWSYPISLPPARGTMGPGPALSYSSQGPVYGGIAAGFAWNLGIPEIREDTSESRLKTHSLLIELAQGNSAGDDDRFIGLGGRRLVKVEEPKGADAYAAYRAQGDDSFQRYERISSGPPFWRVRSTDGSVLEFGGTTAPCSNVSEGYAPLTRALDRFGNETTYTYEEVVTGECRLRTIEWGANGSTLQHFARVELLWRQSIFSPPPSCNGIPVGSQTDYRTGTKIVTGASFLDVIRVTAFPPGQPGSPVHTREITLLYSSQHARCDQPHAPVRLLTSIQESASGTDSPLVALPPLTLEYGDPAIAFPDVQPEQQPWSGASSLAWGYRYALSTSDLLDRSPTLETMLVDLDGDGLVDRLVNSSSETGDGVCRATWQRNGGPGATPQFVAAGEIVLPRLKWGGTTNPPPQAGSVTAAPGEEKCSLAGQVTTFWNSTDGGGCHDGLPFAPTACHAASDPDDLTEYCDPNGRQCPAGLSGNTANRTNLYYRWLDADGDGLTDLVAAVHGDIRTYDIEQGNYPFATPPPAEPLPFGQPWPACPNDVDRCKDVNPDCIIGAQGDLAEIQVCIDSAPSIGCDDLINTPYGVPNSTEQGPYTRCEGLYPWFIFKNQGSGTFGNATIKYQPVPLESDMGDSSLGAVTGIHSQHHAVADFDGDGVLDAIAKPNPQYGHFWCVRSPERTGRCRLPRSSARYPPRPFGPA